MDLSSSDPQLDPSHLPNIDPFAHPLSPDHKPTPTKSRKRKHSTYSDIPASDDDAKVSPEDPQDGFNSPPRKSRPPGTKRACNQCRQQKLKCNVVEDPWKDCDRCQKHNLQCEITADFKRVGKRSQQAELERSNRVLSDQVQQLTRELATYRGNRDPAFELFPDYVRRNIGDRDSAAPVGLNLTQDDGSQDAALLLHLKSGHDLSGARASPVGHQRKLGTVYVPPEMLNRLWEEYFANYHHFLGLLDYEVDSLDSIFEGSEILFWTVIVVASRHFAEDNTLLRRLIPPYSDLLKETISKPPNNHYVVKALCLICYWPLPVSSTTADMTFAWSGVMMKFAMQLGLHRPSHPMDFSRTRVQLREEDISDRLKTWAICNLVAQNISTGYGQPPDTVYDSTLNALHTSAKHTNLHTRLQIEKLADKVTRNIYSPQQNASGPMEGSSVQMRASMIASDFQNLVNNTDLSDPLNQVYASAVGLHLRLFVFFSEPSSDQYKIDIADLYTSAESFLKSVFSCGLDVRYVPNYIYQMMSAAAVALLKLLHSFFADFVDREAGEQLFWDTIEAIRQISVRTNDLPQRLAEVFAQMFKADTERGDLTSSSTKNGDLPGSSLTLKRRYRMSMSHVFDSIWRWKDEIEGKVRAEKLDAAVRNPTSPQATTHRGSFSNGRRPSHMVDENATLGMPSFGGFGGLTLSGGGDLAYANSYEFFDPVGWYLDGLFESTGMGFQ